MRFAIPAALLAGGLLLLGACDRPGKDRLERVVLPPGDAAAGRRAFVDLQCWVCHRVGSVPDLPEPTLPVAGASDLSGGLAGQRRGQILSSIIAPGHVDSRRVEVWAGWTGSQRVWLGPGQVPPPAPTLAAPMQRMKDYRAAMSVAQLCDLVTFLEAASR